MSRRHQKTWPALILLVLFLSREILASSGSLDQLLLDDLDLGIARLHDSQPQANAQELWLSPSGLEFPRTPLANIANHAVTIFNNHINKTLYLHSVFSLPQLEGEDGPHNDFHVPFVRDIAISPQGNYTFTVVYLPTRIGAVQTEILVRTSFGQMKYQVKGVGIASPFKVVPLTNLVSYAGHPANAAFIPDITLYNPFDRPIEIQEIYSSGGKFYLELPTLDASPGSTAANPSDSDRAQLWTIGAYEKRAVIRVRFVGSLVAGNYTAYIRMKVKTSQDDDELADDICLVIPIRMEVRAMQRISLYPERSLIDLGSVLLNERRPLSINIHTSDTPDIGVASVAWESELAIGESTTRFHRILDCSDIVVGDDGQVRLKIECDLQWAEVIQNISRTWSAFVPGAVVHVSGGVTVNSTVGGQKSAQVHRIPLFAELIPGSGLELPQNVTVLYPKASELSMGIFYLRNHFETPVVVTGIRLVGDGDVVSHPAYVAMVEHLQSAAANEFPRVLRPGESWTMAPTVLPMETSNSEGVGILRSFTAQLQISTNITEVLNVPLYAYSGRLIKLILNNDVRQLINGKRGFSLKESEMVTKENADLLDFGTVRLDVEAHKYMALLNDNPVSIELLRWTLPAMDLQMSIYNVGCMNKYEFGANKDSQLQPDDWCVFSFSATTNRPGEYNGTFLYETTLENNQLPIKITGNAGTLTIDPESLVMRNCFPKTICIADINVESTYSETVYVQDIITHKEASVHVFTNEILPNQVTKVGLMYFNPRMNRIEPPGYTNGYSNQIFDNTNADGLMVLQRTAISMYRVLQERQFLLALQLATDRQTLSTSVSVNFIWPRLIAKRDGNTERVVMVGQEYSYNISLLNPSDETIGYWYFLTDDRFFIMKLAETPLCGTGDALHQLLGGRVMSTPFGNRGLQKFVLLPGQHRNITIHVSGTAEAGSYATMFVLKNNFTFFEGAWQRVKIVQPQFKFGNRKPFSTTPLLFEVQDLPNACPQQQDGSSVTAQHSVISTKRVFTAKNSGSLPLSIKGISINGEPCSGFGFVVLNCAPFELAPNETHKIEISFVPDFTVSRVERKLDFQTDVDFPIQYTLVGTVPQPMLDRCGPAVDRPWWEAALKKWALSLLGTMTVIVATVAYFESLKILKDHSDATYRQRGPFQAPLDFKKLAVMKSQTTAVDAGPTKEIAKAMPKKKTPPPSTSNLFNSKRFSWFINRSQQAAAAAAATAASQGDLTSETVKATSQPQVTTASSDKKSVKKTSERTASQLANSKQSIGVESNSKSANNSEVTSASKKQAAFKKEPAPAKKSKGKAKAAQPTKPSEPEPKVNNNNSFNNINEPKVEIVEAPSSLPVPSKKSAFVDKAAATMFTSLSAAAMVTPPAPLTTLLPEQSFIPAKVIGQHSLESSLSSSPISSTHTTYGKTPGRERKEKLQVTGGAKRSLPLPGRMSNKVPLFQDQPLNSRHSNVQTTTNTTDPWTSACRGLFHAQPPDTVGDMQPGHSSLEYPGTENAFTPRFDPNLMNMNFEVPRDVSGLTSNGHAMSEQLNGFPENPLGAIGTIPPVSSKNYSLFDTENRNPMMPQHPQQMPSPYGSATNSNGVGQFYNNSINGYGSHLEYPGNYSMSGTAAEAVLNNHSGYNNFNMEMFENQQARNSQQLYAEYQYQKQELQRLALLLALQQAQAAEQQQQQTASMSQNTHNSNTMSNGHEYMGWDQIPQQQQQQPPQQRQTFGRTGGPPPGLAPRQPDPETNNNNVDSSNQYDPFRSIWNQWNSNQ